MLREGDVGEAEGPALRREEPAEIELLGRARARLRMLVGLGVDADVGEEPVEERGHGTASGGTAGGAAATGKRKPITPPGRPAIAAIGIPLRSLRRVKWGS